ncbi:MAG TPA: ferredoxin--NADP reductase [Dongiaceae bacterium]|nr:ferredoxin--NADP reductase [Dongiaceae bacterium]
MATFPLRVVERRMEATDTASLWLAVPSDLKATFAHRPGQFVTVEAEIEGETLARQYSLSSSPQDEHLRITVKKIPGGRVSTWLVDEVEIGQLVAVAPPRGRFLGALDRPHRVLLLAAGSGIAPILPIARHLAADHDVTLVYGNRSRADIALHDEVRNLAKATVELALTRPDESWDGLRGRIDAELIAARYPRWRDSDLPVQVYLCGPEGMMDGAEAFLAANGVAKAAIRRESFDLVLDDADDEPPIEVACPDGAGVAGDCTELKALVGGESHTVNVEAGESLLAALLRAGADVPFSCQEGTCSSCIVKLRAGTVAVRPGILKTLRREDLDEGLVLACLARPRTVSVTIDFDEI